MEVKAIACKIPRSIIYNKDLGEKRSMFYLYLYSCIPPSGDFIIISNESVKDMGFKPDRHKGCINDEFNIFICNLIDGGYLKEISKSRTFTKYTALKKIEDDIPFGLIQHQEFKAIINNEQNKISSLLLLSFLRLNSYKKKKPNDKRPEIYYCHLNEIADRIGLSARSIKAALSTLSDIGILYGEEQRRYKDQHGNWHSGLYLFIDKVKYIGDDPDQSYDWRSELECATKWLRNEQERFLFQNS